MESTTDLILAIEDKCKCDDCEAAVSPLAYLADLLQYLIDHLDMKVGDMVYGPNDGPTKIILLHSYLGQRFGSLPTDCDAMNEKLCQYRIAIEVLRNYKIQAQITGSECQISQFETAEAQYLQNAYQTLLEQFGTDYYEVRSAANSTDEKKKQKLADKIGIVLLEEGSSTPTVNTLYNTQPDNSFLENVFGLRAYTKYPDTDTETNTSIKRWKKEYQRLLWHSQDNNTDRYSLADENDPFYILDPDLLTIDDFRPVATETPHLSTDFSFSENAARNIWIHRRDYVDDKWNSKFNHEDYWTPNGIEPGDKSIRLEGDYRTDAEGEKVFLPGQKIRIDGSTCSLNNKVYTIKKVGYTAAAAPTPEYSSIYLTEVIPHLSEIYGSKLIYQEKIEIDTISSATQIELDKTPVGLLAGDKIEIRGSLANDGIYEVETDPIDETVTLVSTGATIPDINNSNGFVYYNVQIDVTDDLDTVEHAAASPSYIRVSGDHQTQIQNNAFVHIENSSKNDGKYKVSDVSYSNGITEIQTEDQLPTDIEDGEITFLSIEESYNKGAGVGITPDMGARTIKTDSGLDLTVLDPSNFSIQLHRTNACPGIEIYDVDSIDTGENSFKLEQAILGNEKDGFFRLVFENVDVSSGYFELDDDLTDFVNDTDNIEVNGVSKSIEIVSFNTKTEITLDDDTLSDPTATVVVLFDFPISEIDNSGKKFSFDPPVEVEELTVGAKFSLVDSDNASNTNNSEYTIVSIAVVSNVTEIEVSEPILNEDIVIENAIIKHTETSLPIYRSRPKLKVFFDFMYDSAHFSYEWLSHVSSIVPRPWKVTGIANVEELIAQMMEFKERHEAGDTEIKGLVETNYHLPIDAFIRAVEIYEAHDLFIREVPGAVEVTMQEYEELFNILIAAIKNTLAQSWLDEEQENLGTDIRLNYSHFWFSMTEPSNGNIDVAEDRTMPYIDPELAGLGSLPDYAAGQTAIDFWNQRTEHLENVKKIIKKIFINQSFDDALNFGLGGIAPYETPDVDLEELNNNLNVLDTGKVAQAELIIRDQLLMSVEDFRYLLEIKARLETAVPPKSAELDEAFGILASAYKKRLLYPEWQNDESTASTKHWTFRKASLPQWRASQSARRYWQKALEQRNKIPMVDPDLVFPEDFNIKGYSSPIDNPAYPLGGTRLIEITDIFNDLNDELDTGIHEAVLPAIGESAQYLLEELPATEEAGVDIRPRLKQLHLPYQNFSRLLALYKAAGGTSFDVALLNDEEREELVNILVQAYKWCRFYGRWNDQESGKGAYTEISLSPIFFKSREIEYSPDGLDFYNRLKKWRATWKERTRWEKKLKSREKQRESIYEMIATVIEETEAQVLPIMRDALVMFCGEEKLTLRENAKALSDMLLVDFQMTCCQKTTRLSQAIDTIQQLIWRESIGLDTDIYIDENVTIVFDLDSDNFEEEWKWLGSYATWRAISFVFMYPENLLLPSLKRVQSPAFAKLVKELRGNNRLTPLAACHAAKDYAEYFEDVANLEPQATCNTDVRIQQDECVNGKRSTKQAYFFTFATAKKSKRAYFHMKRMEGEFTGDFSFWLPIEGLGGGVKQIKGEDAPVKAPLEGAVQILGSAVYEIESGVRYIYLFAKLRVEFQNKLVYIRYDLETQIWDQEYSELSLPEDVDFNNVVVLQRSSEDRPPKFAIRGSQYKALFTNSLNHEGKDWARDEWEQLTSHHYGKDFDAIKGYIEFNNFTADGTVVYEEVIFVEQDSYILYKILSSNFREGQDTGNWGPASFWAGSEWNHREVDHANRHYYAAYAIRYPDPCIQVHCRSMSNSSPKLGIIKRGTISFTYDQNINSASQLSGYVHVWTRVDLKDIRLNNEEREAIVTALDFLSAYNLLVDFDGYNKSVERYSYDLLGFLTFFDDLGETFYDYGINKKSSKEKTFLGKKIKWGSFVWKMQETIYGLAERVYDAVDESTSRDLKWIDKVLHNRKVTFKTWDEDDEITLTSVIRVFNQRAINIPFNGQNSNFDVNFYIKIRYNKRGDQLLELDLTEEPDSTVHNSGYYNDNGYRAFSGHNEKSGVFAKKIHSDLLNIHSWEAVAPNHFVLNPTTFTIIDPENKVIRLNPLVDYSEFTVTEEMTSVELQNKRSNLELEFIDNFKTNTFYNYVNSPLNIEYLREAYYFVPMMIGIQLSQRGHHEKALQWFKTVYDYTAESVETRRIYGGLQIDSDPSDWLRNLIEWLHDPVNPHSLARTRENAYHKYTVYTIAQTFISYANAQFTIDTVETVSKARALYEFAVELLGLDIFKQKPDLCEVDLRHYLEQVLCELGLTVDPGYDLTGYEPIIEDIYAGLQLKVLNHDDLAFHASEVNDLILYGSSSSSSSSGLVGFPANIAAAAQYVNAIVTPESPTVEVIINDQENNHEKLIAAAMSIADAEIAAIVAGEYETDSVIKDVAYLTGYDEVDITQNDFPLPDLGKEKGIPSLDLTEESHQKAYNKSSKKSKEDNNGTAPQPQFMVAELDLVSAVEEFNNYPFPMVRILNVDFCVPENPVYKWAALSAELNLFKIRNCMNIAGMKRELDPYAAPTDTTTGLPQIGANGQIVLPGTINIKPTIFRYEYLIERAKQLVGIAQQIESAFLSALEKRDAEYYNVLKAKQDLSLSKATLKLKDLQIKVAEGEVDLAQLQKERAQIQVEGLEEMIEAGLNEFEEQMIDMYWTVAALNAAIHSIDMALGANQISGSIIFGLATNAGSKLGELGVYSIIGGVKLGLQQSAELVNAGLSVNNILASQARREQEWNFQKTLATHDIKIGVQQVKIAQDRVRVANQDRVIADLQVRHAEDTIEFLNNKFTNVDLYDWMSGVLEGVYSFFLQQATGNAKLAQNQLAFERQEIPTGIIQDDYWETPTDNLAIITPGANAPDRRGLTGSARLLQDIYRLDQYAQDTDKRKLQLSKTFSLATMAPMEFQIFRETGEIVFDTLMEYFDRDFPGHYLRLIKKVRTSVIALIPLATGIKATLTSSGISHTVIGGTIFQDTIIRRDPESIAFTGTADATGVFDMQMQDPKYLNPFEGSGVHTRWQLKLPKDSNLFDFNTIADVLITIDYTALNSFDYEQQVSRRLGPDISADRAFSFRNELADAFYTLKHPAEFEEGAIAEFDIRRFDFPANINDIVIEHLKFYFITDRTDPTKNIFTESTFEFGVSLNPAEEPGLISGRAGVNSNGITSTLTNGGGLTVLQNESPVGKWTIDVNDVKEYFEKDEILDIVMVITYSGTLPRAIQA